MRFALLVILGLAAGSVAAQTMYKCTGADGKTSFSDRPCASPGAKQQVQNVPTTIVENARRMGISERYLRSVEEHCSKGDLTACQAVEDVRSGPAPEVPADELARRWKSSVDTLAAMQRDCKGGGEWMCLRLERIKRTTPEQEAKDRQAMLQKMCAGGYQAACAGLDEPNRVARGVAEHRAEERRRALVRQNELCGQGDRAACARAEDLRKNP